MSLRLVYRGSAGRAGDWPEWSFPEVAVAGRSNAGKSSLLNRVGGARVARVSRTPGRTQRLHFFVDEGLGLALVDLPGYGYARASRHDREAWGRLVDAYLRFRQNLRAFVLLVDVRRRIEEDERLLERFALERDVGMIRVATKVDKLNRAGRKRELDRLSREGGPWIPFSARTGEGADEVLSALERIAVG